MCHAVRFDFPIIVIAAGGVGQDSCHRASAVYVGHEQRRTMKTDHIAQKPIFPLETIYITQQSIRKRMEMRLTFVTAINELQAVVYCHFVAI